MRMSDWSSDVRSSVLGSDPAVYAHFCRLNVRLFKEGDPIEKEAALIEFVGHYDTEQGLSIKGPTVPSNLAERIRPALDCLCASPTATTTLEKLADLAGMSRYQVIRAFRAVTGMTPHAWQLNQSVNLAREWQIGRASCGERVCQYV